MNFGFSHNIGRLENLAFAEQCLHRTKAFSASYLNTPVRRLRVHKKLGGNTDRTGDSN